jgi:hypothetical protein
MLRTIFGIILFSIFVTPVFALEITNYGTITALSHNVTVALEDLSQTSKVRCVIKKNGKPVGMGEQYIKGVGTIEIYIASAPTKTTATCFIVK